jgi:hypothetical protein
LEREEGEREYGCFVVTFRGDRTEALISCRQVERRDTPRAQVQSKEFRITGHKENNEKT